jgi:hypothetical protein
VLSTSSLEKPQRGTEAAAAASAEAEPSASSSSSSQLSPLEKLLSRVPAQARKPALELLAELSETRSFSANLDSGAILISGSPLTDYNLLDLVTDTCVPFNRPRFPDRLCAFLQQSGLTRFRNHRADIRPPWVSRHSFPASTTATRWAPFVAQRRSASKLSKKASK